MWIREQKPGLEAIKVPTAIDIAWAAGIFEGEGTCSIKGGGKGSYSTTVAQKDPDLLYRMRDLFGGTVRLYKVGEKRKFECHRWAVSGEKARVFLASIYPFLTARRKSQIDVTNASYFLEFANDLLRLPEEEPCPRFQSILAKVDEFNKSLCYENKSKRQEYTRKWQNDKYRNDPVYRAKRLAAKREAKRVKREQKLHLVEMQKSA